MRNHIPPHEQAGRAGRAVIINVVYWDSGHSELVEYALSASRVAIAIACDALLDVVIVDVRV